MNKLKYLERIGYAGSVDVSDEVLAKLHRYHVHNIPFENLDVYYKKRFDLNLECIYNKVVENARGGFCYELNLLFNWLLAELGFSSQIIAARIFGEDELLGPEFDHMGVYVKAEKDFLVDVGYGDLFITPLEIREGEQFDGRNYFRIERWKEEYLLSMSENGVNYSKRYIFNLNPVKVNDFAAICLDKQVNPDSYFVKNMVCTRATETGRVTIFNHKLVERDNGVKKETAIEGDSELRKVLRERFDVRIKD